MFSKNLLGTISTLAIGGTLLVASTFNGTDTLNQAKSHLSNMGNSLVQFKTNENKLVSAINTLKSSKQQLLAQIEQLQADVNAKQSTIDSLNNQITSLNTRIAELEELLANGGNNNEELQQENDRLTNELVKANLEIDKANNLVNELKQQLTTSQATLESNKPLTETEINNIVNDTTTPVTPPQEPPTTPVTPPVAPTYDYTISSASDEYYMENLNIMIMGNTWIFEGTAQYPIVVYFTDGTTKNVNPNSTVSLTKAIDKIEYKTANNTLKVIDVNR